MELPTKYHLSGLACQPTQLFGERALQGLRPCWVPARNTAFRISGLEYAPPFKPDFIWMLQGEAASVMHGGHDAKDWVPWATRSFAYILFCHQATVQLGFPARVECNNTRSSLRTPPPTAGAAEQWHVAAFSGHFTAWQHLLINGAPMFGMGLALVGAGHRTTFIDHVTKNGAGTLDLPLVRRSSPELPFFTKALRSGEKATFTNFAIGAALPFTAESCEHVQLPFQCMDDSYPRFAYDAAFSRRPNWGRLSSRVRVAAFLSRSTNGPRHLSSSTNLKIVRGLRELLPMPLEVVSDVRPSEWFAANVSLVLGVHGGAFANVHALPPGASVVEIVHPDGPRCYAAMSFGRRLRYFAYWPARMPRPPPKTREHLAHGPVGRVRTFDEPNCTSDEHTSILNRPRTRPRAVCVWCMRMRVRSDRVTPSDSCVRVWHVAPTRMTLCERVDVDVPHFLHFVLQALSSDPAVVEDAGKGLQTH